MLVAEKAIKSNNQSSSFSLSDSLAKGGDDMKYFVKNKRIHEYPLPPTCNVGYDLQTVYEHPPMGYERCEDCYPKS